VKLHELPFGGRALPLAEGGLCAVPGAPLLQNGVVNVKTLLKNEQILAEFSHHHLFMKKYKATFYL